MFPVVFTLVAVSSWTYGGFLAKPSPASSPTPPAVPTGSPLTGPAAPPPPVVVVPPVDPPKAPLNPPAPEPTEEASTESRRYQLADVSGQVWEHTDPAWLQEFVRDRNRQLVGFPR